MQGACVLLVDHDAIYPTRPEPTIFPRPPPPIQNMPPSPCLNIASECRHNARPASLLSSLGHARLLTFWAQLLPFLDLHGPVWHFFPYIWVPGLTLSLGEGTRPNLSRHDEKAPRGEENATIRGNVWLRIEHRLDDRLYSVGSCQGVREILWRESGRDTRRDHPIIRNAGLSHRHTTKLGAKSEFRILDDGDDTGREKDPSATMMAGIQRLLLQTHGASSPPDMPIRVPSVHPILLNNRCPILS